MTKKHIFKRAHNNFLLFTNELSENLNRLRGHELDKYEIKGIIFEINNSVLRHRPILKKAIEETSKWKEVIEKELVNFIEFKNKNLETLTESDLEELDRRVRQLEIYLTLLEEDINDYKIDLEAIEEVYGEHLQFQEVGSPFFFLLDKKALENIEKYNQHVRGYLFNQQISVCSSVVTRKLDYKFLTDLNSLWKYSNTPVVDQEGSLVGFLIGPGKLDDEFGALIYQQSEVSLSTIRRIYDYIVAPNLLTREEKTDEEKKLDLLNEIPIVLPIVPFNYLVPDVVIAYCKKKEFDLSNELLKFLQQPGKIIFVPISKIEKGDRKLIITSDVIRENGELLPNFDLKKNNDISKLLLSNEHVVVKDIFGEKVGVAHSIISHPRKGHFLIVRKEVLTTDFYATIYDLLSYGDESSSLESFEPEEKKWRLLLNLSREYNKSEAEVAEAEFLKKVLIEKNTGILPHDVENANYVLYSIGNVRIMGDTLQVAYLAPALEIQNVFDLEGKIVENVKGKELGVVYTLTISEKPSLLIWSKIDLVLISSFISEDPMKLLKEKKDFIDNLAISIGKHLSLAPQVALRPDNVIAFMNLIGKINSYNQINEIMERFEPSVIELSRIISIDKQRILVDITEEEIIKERGVTEIVQEQREPEYVTSPDYYLRQRE
ncbi:MAG: hypothetical protein ACTSPI_17890, partial [Candidatus Heimdallarchaeaceae archaeon]